MWFVLLIYIFLNKHINLPRCPAGIRTLTCRSRVCCATITQRDIVLYVVRLGFEPRQAEPKSAVLPLHHRTIFNITEH